MELNRLLDSRVALDAAQPSSAGHARAESPPPSVSSRAGSAYGRLDEHATALEIDEREDGGTPSKQGYGRPMPSSPAKWLGVVAGGLNRGLTTLGLGGHPSGLYFLAMTEVWERFSYYGMRALLVLYMTGELFKPGNWEDVYGISLITGLYGKPDDTLSQQDRADQVTALSSNIYGLYTALVYLTPLPGGLLADRVMGDRRAVMLGAALMTAGHFLMADRRCFLLALLLLIAGNGFFKPNISSQVGRLYAPADGRRDAAFSLFYCGINLGALASPLVAGALQDAYGYGAGFTSAGAGMVLAFLIYGYAAWAGHLPAVTSLAPQPSPTTGTVAVAGAGVGAGTGAGVGGWGAIRKHGRRVGAIVGVCALNVLFWACYEQQGNTMAIFSEEDLDRNIGGWAMPSEWIQSLNPLMILAFTPVLTALWRWQAQRGSEPSPLAKMAAGCLLLGVSFFELAGPTAFSDPAAGRRLPLGWMVLSIGLMTLGELYLSPVGLSFLSELAPPELTSFLFGVWFLSSFFGNYLAGSLGALYPKMAHYVFWCLIGALASANGLAMIASLPLLRRALADPPPPKPRHGGDDDEEGGGLLGAGRESPPTPGEHGGRARAEGASPAGEREAEAVGMGGALHKRVASAAGSASD